jgi:DNA-binding CsgD family transcriptional regulator
LGAARTVGARADRGRRPVKLTRTEHQVVELAASGCANTEIAQALSLAVHTVETHLSRAYAKLGVNSRSQLAAGSNSEERVSIL